MAPPEPNDLRCRVHAKAAVPRDDESTLRDRSGIGPNEGAAGLRRFFQDIEDASPDFHLELERLELVGDQALAFHASGRVSGVPLDLETANLFDFAGDLIKCVRIFSDRQEALEVLGMQE